jgi:hypothetical protein
MLIILSITEDPLSDALAKMVNISTSCNAPYHDRFSRIYMPVNRTGTTPIWIIVIVSPRNKKANISPNTDDRENTRTVLTVPILLKAFMKKNNDAPNANDPNKIILSN